MEAEFIPYEQALELKELEFDEPINAIWLTNANSELQLGFGSWINSNKSPDYLSAPLYQQAFRWFREKYQLHSTITSVSQESWQWHITKPGENLCKLYDDEFNTYEEAELECLRKLIEIVKNK